MKSILIIEDNLELREEVAEILGFSGFRVFETDNGTSGIKMAKTLNPDLILCDIMIPEGDGFDVLDQLKNHETAKFIPFIFITSLTDRTSMRNGMELGADDFLTKPFTEKELKKAIHIRLEKQEQWKTAKVIDQLDADVKNILSELNKQIASQKEYIMQITTNKEELIEKLNERESELEKLAIKSIESTQALEELKNQLQRELLSGNLSAQQRRKIHSMVHKIERTNRKEDILREFQIRFNKLHPGFISCLLRNYPGLTQMEITITSAILLNLNSSQIASILYISPASVRKYRYRIKKKFGLSKEEKLLNFIQTFCSGKA
ncbi:MAG: response regulator [Bacteroidota bacterium]